MTLHLTEYANSKAFGNAVSDSKDLSGYSDYGTIATWDNGFKSGEKVPAKFFNWLFDQMIKVDRSHNIALKDLDTRAETNTTDISTNKANIGTNKTDITNNTNHIATNKTAIATNQANILKNANANALHNLITGETNSANKYYLSNGAIWQCLKDNSDSTPATGDNWKLVSKSTTASDIATLQTKITAMPTGTELHKTSDKVTALEKDLALHNMQTGIDNVANQYYLHNGAIWQCLKDNSDSTPATGDNWKMVSKSTTASDIKTLHTKITAMPTGADLHKTADKVTALQKDLALHNLVTGIDNVANQYYLDNGAIWQCLKDNSDSTPTAGANWALILPADIIAQITALKTKINTDITKTQQHLDYRLSIMAEVPDTYRRLFKKYLQTPVMSNFSEEEKSFVTNFIEPIITILYSGGITTIPADKSTLYQEELIKVSDKSFTDTDVKALFDEILKQVRK